MLFGLFTLFSALLMSGLAAWFSIQGLVSIYAAMPLEVMLLAGGVELCKLVAASWIFQSWSWSSNWLKGILAGFVVGVMIVTSIGIFGLLSKAHEDTLAKTDNNVLRIERIDIKIEAENKKIERLQGAINQLDNAIDIYFKKEYLTRGLAQRELQQPQRDKINFAINEHIEVIDELIDKKQPMIAAIKEIQREIGPLKAIAELIYGEDNAESYFDDALRWLTMLLVVIFDPFAVALVIAGNMTIRQARSEKKSPIVKSEPHKIKGHSEVDFIPKDAIIKDKDWYDRWAEKPTNKKKD